MREGGREGGRKGGRVEEDRREGRSTGSKLVCVCTNSVVILAIVDGKTQNTDGKNGEFFTITIRLTKTLVLITGSCPQ